MWGRPQTSPEILGKDNQVTVMFFSSNQSNLLFIKTFVKLPRTLWYWYFSKLYTPRTSCELRPAKTHHKTLHFKGIENQIPQLEPSLFYASCFYFFIPIKMANEIHMVIK